MKLSLILELLIISGLIAYAASRNVAETSAGANAITEAAKQAEFELEIAPAVTAQIDHSAAGQSDDISDSSSATAEEEDEVIEDQSAAGGESNEIADQVAQAAEVADPVVQSVAAPVAAVANATTLNTNDPNPINRYCTCAAASCKCCREFSLPIVPVRGPGCATLKYLEDDKMLVTVKYGDIVLTSRTISGRRATPICIPLPGGYSRFCGRVYGISRKDENFKACLGLELRAEDEVEAALRVSCFQFGPKGLATTAAEPLPPVVKDETDDDDDEDDLFGLGGGLEDDDDDDDDDDDEDGGIGIFDGGQGASSPTSSGGNTDATADDDDDDDDGDLGFSLLGANLLDDLFAPSTKKPATVAAAQSLASGPVKASLLQSPSASNKIGAPINKIILPVNKVVVGAGATNKMPTKTKKKSEAVLRAPKPKGSDESVVSVSDASPQSSEQNSMMADLMEDLQEQRNEQKEDLADDRQDILDDMRHRDDGGVVRSTARPKVTRTKKAKGSDDLLGLNYLGRLLNWFV